MTHQECGGVRLRSPLLLRGPEGRDHMEYTSANPAVDLLHHFASNLSGIRLHVDLGVREKEYPDPSFFLAIQQACGSDFVYARFAAIFLDFERGVKSSEAAFEESLELIMGHARGSYRKLELVRELLEPFFALNSRMEQPEISESEAQTSLPLANGVVDLRCDGDRTNSDSTVTVSSCTNSSELQSGDATSCLCHGCSRRGSSKLAGSDENTTWVSLEQRIFGILLHRASLRLSKHIFRFFHQARRKLRDRNVYLEFLRILESFHGGLIDDFELRILAYSCVKSAETASKASRLLEDGQAVRSGAVSKFDFSLPDAASADYEFRARLQGNPPESTRRISDGFRSKVRVEPVEDVSDEDASCENVLQDHPVNSGGHLVKVIEHAPTPSGRCGLDSNKLSPDSDCPPAYQCALCEESARDSSECTSLMNKLDLIYSPHSADCVCGSMEDGQMGRRTHCSDTPLKLSADNPPVSAKPKVRNRVTVDSDNRRNEERRTTRSRKPTAKFLESLQTSR